MTYRPPFPDEADVLQSWLEQHSSEIRTAMPGRIVRYDATKQVADVQPLVRLPVPQPDGSVVQEDQPVVPSVPVIFPRSTAYSLTLPLTEGDTVLLVCCESAIGSWRVGSGAVSDPGDERRHHLSNAVALPGLYRAAQALTHAAPNGGPAMVLGHDTTGCRVALGADGSCTITRGTTVVVEVTASGEVRLGTGAAQFVALSNLVNTQLSALKTAISGAAVLAGDGGATFKTNLLAALSTWPGSTAAGSVKAV